MVLYSVLLAFRGQVADIYIGPGQGLPMRKWQRRSFISALILRALDELVYIKL